MSFTDLFIRRPVFATVLSLVIFIVGLVAVKQLPVRQFPKTDASVISITTEYPGASASLVESFVSQPIENAISGIDNIDYITSNSTAGNSTVNLYLKLNVDINAAMLDVQSKLPGIMKKLPDDVADPVIKKQDPDASPVMIVAFADPQKNQEQMTDYLTRSIIPQFSNVTGVSDATIFGKRTYAIRIWLNPKWMAARSITLEDVSQALENSNIQAQAGEIDRQSQILSVNASTTLNSPAQFDRLIIKRSNNEVVRLHDIGHAELGASDTSSSIYINGKQGVGVGIIAKSNANPLQISAAINAMLNQIKQQLPPGMTVTVARDASLYVQQSLHEVSRTILAACLCVALVILLFLGNLRSVLIPMVTIPLSLIGVCSLMLAMGYSINVLTLLASVLAIGMVVDDAIVVLENIYRHIEEGKSPKDAALLGAREICFAVIAMTFTLAAVYAPIGFSSGLTGALFREFAFTLAGTVIVSGFIALTLSPMMCAQILRPPTKVNAKMQLMDAVFNWLTNHYQRLLIQTLQQRSKVIMAMFTIFCCGGLLLIPLVKQSSLAPREDQGTIMAMMDGPTASNIHYTEQYTQQLAKLFDQLPETDRYIIVNGRGDQSSAMAYLALKPWDQRKRGADAIISELNAKAQGITGMRAMLASPSSLPVSSSNYPLELDIKTSGSYAELSQMVNAFVQQAEQNPNIVSMQSKLALNKPELSITVDRDKADALGVSMNDIAQTLKLGLGQPAITTYIDNGLTYDVIVELAANDMNNPQKINNMNVRTESGKLVPLSNLVHINNVVAPTSLLHFQGQRAATIGVALAPNYSTGAAITYFNHLAQQILPTTMSLDFAGEARQYLQAGSSMLDIFCFSLVFIYLVLSAQFESFKDPLVVMLSVPVALTGALATLFFTHSSLNIYTEIGLITLIGLITKHGILIVTFANQQRSAGLNCFDAVVSAASIRLRPILMTTAAMVLGAIPLVLASGAGAVARQQIGLVIVGGMTFGTLFTLFVVPTCYTLLAFKAREADFAEQNTPAELPIH